MSDCWSSSSTGTTAPNGAPNRTGHRAACDARVAVQGWRQFGVSAVTVQKIKSHQDVANITDGSSTPDVRGNERADEFARKGAELPAPGALDVSAGAAAAKQVKKVVKTAGVILAMFPSSGSVLRWQAATRRGGCLGPTRPWRGQEPTRHDFEWFDDRIGNGVGGQARTAKRGKRQGSQMPRPNAQARSCHGRSGREVWDVLYVVRVQGDPTPALFCFRCGADQQTVPRLLSLQWSNRREKQAAVRLRRIYGGRHSTRPSLIGGVPGNFPSVTRTVDPLETGRGWRASTMLLVKRVQGEEKTRKRREVSAWDTTRDLAPQRWLHQK